MKNIFILDEIRSFKISSYDNKLAISCANKFFHDEHVDERYFYVRNLSQSKSHGHRNWL